MLHPIYNKPMPTKPKRIKIVLRSYVCTGCLTPCQTSDKMRTKCPKCTGDWNKVKVEGLQANTLMW